MDELINSADPLRLIWMVQTLHTLWEYAVPWLMTLAPGIILAGLIILGLHIPDLIRLSGGVWTRIKTFLVPKFLQEYLKGKAMQKQRENDQDARGIEAISDWIEAEVEEGTMTRIEANKRYAQLARIIPGLRHCIEWFNMDNPKERLLAEREHRRTVGDKPIPFPKEVPGKNLDVKVRRSSR